MSASEISRAKLATVLIAALFFLIPTLATAAHAPVGTSCQECHSLSRASVFVGTKLIKKEAFLVAANGGNASNDWPQGTNLPCLFCHRAGRAGTTEMRAVEDHFGTGVTSRHQVSEYSSFGGAGSTATFDCVDCHEGLDSYVSPGGTNIHTVDSKNNNSTLLADTLIGGANLPSVDNSMCSSNNCHDTDGSDDTYSDGHAARDQHAFAAADISLGTSEAEATLCSDCHATHKSSGGYSLLILEEDGGHDGSDALIDPGNCAGCHTMDDAKFSAPYAAYGHGKTGITYACSVCHDQTVAHSFASDTPTVNPLRFKFDEPGTTFKSKLRPSAPYTNPYSICGECHQSHDDIDPHGSAVTSTNDPDNLVAGCNDCHNPHGIDVEGNVKMIRKTIRKEVGGVIVAGTETNTYLSVTDAWRSGGDGVCDNVDCHGGFTYNGDALYPLSSLMSSGHSGGTISPPEADADCLGCHKHQDSLGGWSAQDSCYNCHGQPPLNAVTTASGYATFDESKTPHRKHAADGANGGLGLACQNCHADYTDVPPHNDGTFQSLNFTGGIGDATATWPGSVPAYDSGTHTCSNIYCHSDGTGNFTPIQWNANNWDTNDLGCAACHDGIDSGGTQISSNAHGKHLAAGVTCQYCHADTVTTVSTDSTTVADGGGHSDGNVDVLAGGTFNGQAVSFSYAAFTCTSLSCHSSSITWDQDTSTIDCDACHSSTSADNDSFIGNDGSPSNINSSEYTSFGHGGVGTPLVCKDCHDKNVGHDFSADLSGTNPFRLGTQWNSYTNPDTFCSDTTNCHTGVDSSVVMTHNETNAGINYTWGVAAKCVDCHDPHGDATNLKMVQLRVSEPDSSVDGVPVSIEPDDVDFTVQGGYAAGSFADNTDANGICQVCHTQTMYFKDGDTATALASPHPTSGLSPCTKCHPHDKGFKASGCSGCHGDSTNGNYWPDGGVAGVDDAGSADDAGEHIVHMTVIAQRLYGEDLATVVTDTPEGVGDVKQKAICEYCHAANTNDDQHSTGETVLNPGADDAEVFDTEISSTPTKVAKSLWGAVDADATYSAGTCTNVDCHLSTSTATGGFDWYADSAGDCTMCHGAGVTATAAPNTNAHKAHTDNTFYVTDCSDCHTHAGESPASKTATHIDSDIDDVVSYNFGGPDHTCTNTCHEVVTTNDWKDGAGLLCTNCHLGTYIGGGSNAPASGVHQNARISSQLHNQTITGGCEACHNTASISSDHIGGGALNTLANANFNTDVSVDTGVTPTTCAPTGTLASCHADGGLWTRLWDLTAGNSDGSECANCHGGVTTGYAQGTFTAGVSERHADSNVLPNHDGCYYCHLYKNGDTLYYNVNNSEHRDDAIQLNAADPLDLGYDDAHAGGARVGCSNCHSATDYVSYADGEHEFNNLLSNWGRTNLNGPEFSCSSAGCHDGSAGMEFPPITNSHTAHVGSPYSFSCTMCHPQDHDGTADDLAFTGIAAGGSYNSSLLQCSSLYCHSDGQGNTITADWDAKTGGACGDCHSTSPTSVQHTTHINQDTFVPNDCADCHGAGASTSTPPTTGHVNGSVTLAGEITSTPLAANNTCVNNCHNSVDGASDWELTRTLACADCHDGYIGGTEWPVASINHTAHINQDTLVPNDCADCHGAGASSTTPPTVGHMNGEKTLGGQITVSPLAADNTCTNNCHNSVDGASDWELTRTLACADCHNGYIGGTEWPVTSYEHTPHINNDVKVPNDCADCHGAGASATTPPTAGHMNGEKTLGGQITVTPLAGNGTCTNNCHASVAGRGWTDGITLACNDCHGAGGSLTVTGNLTTTLGPATGKHSGHGSANFYITNCQDCHPHGGALGGVHVDGATDTLAGLSYSGGTCTNSCHIVAAGRDWTSGTLLCNDCHGGGGTLTVTGNVSTSVGPASSGRHSAHPGTQFYVNGCTDCHDHSGSLAGTGHVNGTNDTTSGLSYSAGDCTNSCHAVVSASDGDWLDSNPLACTNCHKNGGSVDYVPTSALHDEVPTNTSQIHNETINASGCATCHNSALISGDHIGGTLSTLADTNFVTDLNVDTAASPTTCAPQNGLVGCHFDDGRWSRRWHENADLGDGTTECTGCHGLFGDWVTGISNKHSENDTDIPGSHDGTDKCLTCHSYDDAAAYGTGTYYTWASDHRDGKITLNNQLTIADSAGPEIGCSNCHSDSDGAVMDGEGHEFVAVSGSAPYTGRSLINGPAATCDSCHGNGAGSNWPDNSTAHVANQDDGGHLTHVNAIVAGSNGVSNGNNTCDFCHPANSHSGDGVVPADFGSMKRMNGDPDSGNAATYNTGTFICSNVDCHGENDTPDNWYAIPTGGGDTTPPTFTGLQSGEATNLNSGTGGQVELDWSSHAATDTSTPITYNIWWSTSAIGDPAQGTQNGSTTSTTFVVSGLTDDQAYNFLVRAEDALGNEEGNLSSQSATPTKATGGGGASGSLYVNSFPGTNWSFSALTDLNSVDAVVATATGTSADTAQFDDGPGSGTLTTCTLNIEVSDRTNITDSLGNSWPNQKNTISIDLLTATNAITDASQLVNYSITLAATATGRQLDMVKIDYVTSGTSDTTAPTAGGTPSAVDVTGTSLELEVSWTAGSDSESPPVVYDVYRDVTNAGACTSGTSVLTNFGGTSFVDTVPANGTNYYYCQVTKDSAATPNAATASSWSAAAQSVDDSSGGGQLTCTGCHTWPPSSGAHAAHGATGTTPDTDDSTCSKCHGSIAGVYTNSHSDGLLSFDFTSVDNGDGAYSSTTPGVVDGNCTNMDCHYNSPTQLWNDPTNLGCESCHSFAALPDKHVEHLGSNALTGTDSNECYICHNTSADNTGTALYGTHANGIKEVAFNAFANYEAATAAVAAGSGSTTTCSNVKCHNGVTTPVWSGTVSCGSCHGSGGPLPVAASIVGSHVTAHANNDTDATDCQQCHDAGSYLATGGVSTHQNLAVNLLAGVAYTDGNGAGGVNYSGDGVDNGSCTTNCHGANTPTWGGAAPVCGDCHGDSARATVYDTDEKGYPPVDLANTSVSSIVGKHAEHVAESFAKTGDACNLCHNGRGASGTNHADMGGTGTADIVFNTTYAGTGASYDGATCSGLDCHQDAIWDTSTPGGCNFCHGYPPTSSGTDHSTFTGGSLNTTLELQQNHSDCQVCHGIAAATLNDPASGFGTPTDLTGSSGDAYVIATNHRNGMVEMNGISVPDNSQNAAYNEGTNGCDQACHTGSLVFSGTINTNTVNMLELGKGGCDGCHGYPPVTKHANGATPVDHSNTSGYGNITTAALLAAHNDCVVCHGTKDAGDSTHANHANYDVATQHNAGSITMNTLGTSYNATTFGCDGACHTPLAVLPNSSGMTIDGDDFGGACDSCHTSGQSGQVVTSSSPHTTATGYGCPDCHPMHTGGLVRIPDNPTVGIAYGTSMPADYSNSGGTGGIGLLDAAGSGASNEQGICNGCHSSAHTPWITAQGNYQPGTLSSYTDWDNATWSSANFSSYKPSTIQSKHFNTATDATAQRCSYCHDVHDTWGGPNDGNPPYLRGTWTSNPFPEDGAPQTTAHAVAFGGVPRGGVGTAHPLTWADPANTLWNNAIGGWQIEQNNIVDTLANDRTARGGYSTFGGLCMNCHTEGDLETAWPRHAAVVAGFNNGLDVGSNIYKTSNRGGVGNWTRGYMRHDNSSGANGSYIYGLRNAETKQFPAGTAGGITPIIDPIRPQTGTNVDLGTLLGVTVDDGSTDYQFHAFPCSKCHTPHMSALPRLMITNCLDVVHNNWDNNISPNSYAASGDAYQSTDLAYSPTAVNCHRYVAPGDADQEKAGDPGEPGWNTATPW